MVKCLHLNRWIVFQSILLDPLLPILLEYLLSFILQPSNTINNILFHPNVYLIINLCFVKYSFVLLVIKIFTVVFKFFFFTPTDVVPSPFPLLQHSVVSLLDLLFLPYDSFLFLHFIQMFLIFCIFYFVKLKLCLLDSS